MQILRNISGLMKLRVTTIVVLSSIFGYFLGLGSETMSFYEILGLSLGGFLTTGAANAINQLLEYKRDAKMPRTKDRLLPSGKMSRNEVIVYASIMTVLGAFFFAYFTNTIVLILGISSLLVYSFAYTPMKRFNSVAVFIGAIPGALPPMIGVVAATGAITDLALLLFVLQFVWQLPHFWSIAWIYNDQYEKAGYSLLPLKNGRTKQNALVTFLSSMLLIPTLLLFYVYDFVDVKVVSLIILLTCWFIYKAYKFYIKPDMISAKKLMKSSIIYLPILQLILVLLIINN